MTLSATFSPKVLQTVKNVLKIIDGRHTMIRQPLNRPNIFFGARCIVLQHVDIGKVISIVIVLQLSVSSHWDESIPYIHDNSLLEYSS